GGVAIFYVSHRLDEILGSTDRVVVLRDGELVMAYPTVEATVERMIKDMVGRPLDQVYPKTPGRRTGGCRPNAMDEGLRGNVEADPGLQTSAAAGEGSAPLLELSGVGRAGM